MPIYEYLCGNCGERVEVLVRPSAGLRTRLRTPVGQRHAQLPSMRQSLVKEAAFRPQCDQQVGTAFRGRDLLRAGGALRRATLFHGGNLSP